MTNSPLPTTGPTAGPTRRTTLAAAVAVVGALGLGACSTGGAGSSGGAAEDTLTTLSLYSADSPAGQWLEAMAREFEAANPGVTVQNQFVAQTDLPTTFGKQVLTGDEQDIVLMNLVGDPTTWLENGATVDLTDHLQEWGLGDVFTPAALAALTNDAGQLQAFPLEGYNWPVWYNTDLLAQAGVSAVPTTTDELLATTQALRAAGIQPFVVAGSDYPAPAVFTLVALTVLSEEALRDLFTTGDWSGPQGQEVVTAFTQLRDAGVFTDDSAGLSYPEQVATFGAGQAAILFDGSWGYGNAATAFPDLPVQLGGMPVPPGSPAAGPVSFAGQSTGVWVSANGAQKVDLVSAFVQQIYTPENLGAFAELGYISPAADGMATVEEAELPPLNVASRDLSQTTTQYQPTYDLLAPVVQGAFFRAAAQGFVAGTSAADLTAALEQAWQAQ